MGTGSLPNVTGPAIELDHINDIRNAMRVDFVGRNAAGAATAGQSLGTAPIPWGTLYAGEVNINGKVIDFDNIGSGADTANTVISGRTRTASGQPDFLRAAGTGGGASLDVLATDTDLIFTANAISATISADVTISGLTVAPSTNNTCLVNNAAYSDQLYTKYEGEDGTTIAIDTAGTEITNRIGQFIALKGANEIMMAYVESATELRNVFRGYFFDSAGDPIVRETLADNDTLTILSLGWVFAQNNGTTFDVSYRSPFVQYEEPAGNTDDYWFDITNTVWKRYDGANWITIERTLIGICVIDGTDCIGTRSIDFGKAFSEFMDIEVEIGGDTQVRSKNSNTSISVYGKLIRFDNDPVIFDITTHLESGLTEAADTLYYLYVSTNGQLIISDEKPYDRRGDLRGSYHPYHNWRYVGSVYNDGSSNFSNVDSVTLQDFKKIARVEITSSVASVDFSNIFKPNKNYKIALFNVTSNGTIDLRVEAGGVFDATAGRYSYIVNSTYVNDGTSTATSQASGAAQSGVNNLIVFSWTATQGVSGEIFLANPNKNESYKPIIVNAASRSAFNGGIFVIENNAGFYEPSTPITGITIYGGINITSGVITIYEMSA